MHAPSDLDFHPRAMQQRDDLPMIATARVEAGFPAGPAAAPAR